MRIHKNAWIWCHPDGRYGWTCAFRRGWKGSVYQMHPVSVCKDGLAAPRGCNVLYTQHEELAPCVCVCSTSIEQTKVKAAALFIMWHTMVFIHSFFMYCCHSFTDYCVFPFFLHQISKSYTENALLPYWYCFPGVLFLSAIIVDTLDTIGAT